MPDDLMHGMRSSIASAQGIERVQRHLDHWNESYKKPENRDWSTPLVRHLRIQSHSTAPPHPRVTFRLTVQPEHLNALGNLHGGCAATLFDVCTSLVVHLVARPGFWSQLGVTRTLNVVCLRPVPAGGVVDVECDIVQIGQRLSALRGVLRAVDGPDGPEGAGAVLMTCEHGKVNTDAVAKA